MLKYPARFIPEEVGGFFVEFVDLPGCVTEGDTMEEASAMAKEALTGWLGVAYDHNIHIPDPSAPGGDDIRYIAPDPEVVMPIAIRKLRTERGLTQKQVADALGIKYQAYQRLENPRTFNATVKNLKRIGNVFGKELDIQLI